MDDQAPNPAEKPVLHKSYIIAGGLLLVAIIAGYVFTKSGIVGAPAGEPTNHNGLAYEQLLKNSLSYSQAVQYSKNREFDKAREYFEKAKKESPDIASQGIIAFQLLTMKEGEGKYLEAIDMLKDIVAHSDSYTELTRAYAFLEMGLIYHQFADNAITDRIFEGDVYYKALRDPNDTELTYRHLFEEATKIYPVALAELRIADWYSDQIYTTKVTKKEAFDPTLQTEYQNIVRDRIARADQDVDRILILPNEYAKYGPQSFARKAVIIGKMTLAGDDSLGSVDEAFDAALRAYSTRPGTDGYARFNYAYITARLKKEGYTEHVRQILAPIYTDAASYQHSAVLTFFKNERENVLDSKADLILLASIDPKFKELLMTLGWIESNFLEN